MSQSDKPLPPTPRTDWVWNNTPNEDLARDLFNLSSQIERELAACRSGPQCSAAGPQQEVPSGVMDSNTDGRLKARSDKTRPLMNDILVVTNLERAAKAYERAYGFGLTDQIPTTREALIKARSELYDALYRAPVAEALPPIITYTTITLENDCIINGTPYKAGVYEFGGGHIGKRLSGPSTP